MNLLRCLPILLATAFLYAVPAEAQIIWNNGGGSGGGGSGTVTNIATSCGLTGGPISVSGTVSESLSTNAQTGTTYTVLSGDSCKLVTFSNASAVAVTLPQATGSFTTGYFAHVENKGAGTVTITPTTSTINGAATLTLKTNEGCSIVSDGTNYQVFDCVPAAGSTGTGTFVRSTSPTLVTPALGTPSAVVLTNGTGLVPSTGLSATGTPSGSTCLLGDNTWGACATGGSGITSMTAGAGINLSTNPCTTTCTASTTWALNAQTGTTYTVLSSDAAKLITFSNGSAIAVTLPQATGSFAAGFAFDVQNLGAGSATITPTTSTINGAATLVIPTNMGCSIVSDGTNYQVSACGPAMGVTGTGSLVRATSPTLVTPILGTPTSGNASNMTNIPVAQATGTLPVANGGTGLTAGTSGGVLAYTASGTLASSGALTANLPVIGGGAGVAPTVGTRSGNTTAYVTTTGTQTSGDCVKIDANGNHVANGSACGSGTGGGGMFQYSDNGVTVTAGTYYTPIGGGGIPQTTEANVSVPSPSATTAANLKVSLSADPGSGQTLVVTLRKAGADQTLTCTVTGTGGGAATTCSDTTHSVNIAQGDLINWKVVTTGTYVATPTITILSNNGTSSVGVTSVATNNGLTGGTITTTGTVGLATIAADNLLANSTGSTAIPIATALTSCSAGTSALTYNTSTHAFGCNTISGGTTLVAPQGRLTLVTGVPVQTSDQTAKSVIYYDCYRGNGVPYYTGSADAADTIASCEVSLTMATSGTGVTNSAGVFDIWWVNGGANRICVATNGSGGGWASDTGGSNTARGTGYSQVHNTRGYWTNVNAITNCYNGTTDYGSVSADQGTYLGTIYTTAAGKTGVALKPSAASGGANNIIGLWNAYNRIPFSAINLDSAAAYTFSTNGTWQVQNIGGTGSGLNNRFSFVDGLGQSSAQTALDIFTNNGGVCYFGANRNSTTATPGLVSANVMGAANNGASNTAHVQEDFYPAIGFNYYQFMQMYSNVLGGACNVNGGAGSPQSEGLHFIADY